MRQLLAIIVLALGLTGCGVVDTMVDGYKHIKAVETELQESLGIKPAVGFNWNNGRLTSVSVTFPQPYEAKPLGELAEQVRTVVVKEFKRTPDHIVLGFDLSGKAQGKAAQAL